MGWYRVIYDDGDVEDNTLCELKEILALHATIDGLPIDHRSNEDAPTGKDENKATEPQENDTDEEEEELQFLVSKSAEMLRAERFEMAQARQSIIDLADISNCKSPTLITDAQDAHDIIDLCDD